MSWVGVEDDENDVVYDEVLVGDNALGGLKSCKSGFDDGSG